MAPVKLLTGKNGSYLNLYPHSPYDPTRFERPVLTVDVVILRVDCGVLKALMVRRGDNPDSLCEAYPGCLALPGGYVDIAKMESSDDAAHRELKEETGISGIEAKKFTFKASAERDPRWYTVDLVYYATLNDDQAEEVTKRLAPEQSGEVTEYCWVPLEESIPGGLAFDHEEILVELLWFLRDRQWRYPDVFGFLRKEFTWAELRSAYESIAPVGGHSESSFRKKVRLRYDLETVEGFVSVKGVGRPSTLFRYSGQRDF